MCAAAFLIVTANRNARRVAGINQVVASDDMAGIAMGMFAGQFNSKIHVVNNVALDYNTGSTVDVNAVGVGIVPIGGVAPGGNVVYMVFGDDSIARAIHARIFGRVFESDNVDADVVVVVNSIPGDSKLRHIAVQYERFA